MSKLFQTNFKWMRWFTKIRLSMFQWLFLFDITKIYTKACTLYCIVLIINFFLTIELISIAIKKSRKLAVNLDYYGF